MNRANRVNALVAQSNVRTAREPPKKRSLQHFRQALDTSLLPYITWSSTLEFSHGF